MRRFSSRHRRAVGAVMVEYALLLVAVGIPTFAGLIYGGGIMFRSYQNARDHILRPFP